MYKVLLVNGDSFNVSDLTDNHIKNLNEVASVESVVELYPDKKIIIA